MPWANRLRLTPPLPRSVGLGPVFPPAQGRFGRRPYSANSSPAPSVRRVPVPPATAPRTRQPTESQVGQPGADSAFHWQRSVEDAIGARSGTRGRPPPMGVHMLGDQRCQQSSSEIWNAPVVGLVLVAGPARFGRGGFPLDPLDATPAHAPLPSNCQPSYQCHQCRPLATPFLDFAQKLAKIW